MMNDSLFGQHLLKIKTCKTFFTPFSILTFILTLYIGSHSTSLVFQYPCGKLGNCSSAFSHNTSGIMIHLPFISILSITTRSSLNVQYCFSSYRISFLLNGQTFMKYLLAVVCIPLSVVCCTSCTFWDVNCCANHINAYLHARCFALFLFSVIQLCQAVCYEFTQSRFV